jgi:hypothetical protein
LLSRISPTTSASGSRRNAAEIALTHAVDTAVGLFLSAMMAVCTRAFDLPFWRIFDSHQSAQIPGAFQVHCTEGSQCGAFT